MVKLDLLKHSYPTYEFNNLEEAIECLEHVGVDIDVHHDDSSHKIEKSKI